MIGTYLPAKWRRCLLKISPETKKIDNNNEKTVMKNCKILLENFALVLNCLGGSVIMIYSLDIGFSSFRLYMTVEFNFDIIGGRETRCNQRR